MSTREEKAAKLAASIAKKRAKADYLEAQAARLRAGVSDDYAFWTQPAYGNAAGRAFSSERNRQRAKIQRSGEAMAEATRLRKAADTAEATGARVAGDALAAHTAKITACSVSVGDMVGTTFYGDRRVLKVNRVSVIVEGSGGGLKVGKEFITAPRV